MSAQTKYAPSSSTDTTLSLSVISMFSLYWNVTALEAWNLFRVSCGLSAAVASHMIFLKNYLNIPMMHTCKVNYIAYVCARSVICVSCTKTCPSWDDPNWDETHQPNWDEPNWDGESQLGSGTERQTSQLGRYFLIEKFR